MKHAYAGLSEYLHVHFAERANTLSMGSSPALGACQNFHLISPIMDLHYITYA